MKILKSWICEEGFCAKLNDGKRNKFVIYIENDKKYREFKFIEFENFTKKVVAGVKLDNATFRELEQLRKGAEEQLDLMMYGYYDEQY